jgi:T4-like virus Myoviridae tail sheath stabiliser
MAAVQFAYSGQIRRFVLQFIRMFSNFQVEFGNNSAGSKTLQTVPVYYGDPSRQAAQILKNNSENMMNAVPAMAAYISELSYDRERVLNPYHEGTMRVRQQAYDAATQSYTGEQDGIYTVERLMPAPYKLTMKLDIWTSNTEQKHQIIEQLAPLFNPGLEIQNSENYVDWGSLSVVLLTGVNYSSRTVPAGADDGTIDIATLTFEMPIWISLPAKVKKMGIITEIIARIYDEDGNINPDLITSIEEANTQVRYTPLEYSVYYLGNTVTLYKQINVAPDGTVTGNRTEWAGLINLYGTLRPGISQVRLDFMHTDGNHEIVGTVDYDPVDRYSLLFTPISSTLPANTLPPVSAIIDPWTVTVDSLILNPDVGTRYLILHDIGSVDSLSAPAWAGAAGTNLLAKANSIIQWNGSYWTVSFDSSNTNIQYVTNTKTSTQYFWDGTSWTKSYEGLYNNGQWSLVI